MPEVIRNRFSDQSIGQDSGAASRPDGARVRPGFGADEDPLAELARIVGEAAPQTTSRQAQRQQGGQSVERHPKSVETSPSTATRDFPRRDTSWRDPQALTTVRAGITPQPMPGQLADLEAELFSEIRSENLRSLPPAPDLVDLAQADARMPQYADTKRMDTGSQGATTQGQAPIRQTLSEDPAVSRHSPRPQPAVFASGNADEDVTLPMHAVLRAMPPSARTSEDNRMPQLQRAPVAQMQASPYDGHPSDLHDENEPSGSAHSQHDLDYAHHDAYDPAGALAGAHGYQSDEAYYGALQADLVAQGGQAYGSLDPHLEDGYGHAHYDENDDGYGQPQLAPDLGRRDRRRGWSSGLIAVSAVVGVLVLGVGSFLTYRAVAGGGLLGGSVPLIRADGKPMKELVAQQPVGASGPNLDTARPEGQDKLVTQTEDPVDHIPGKPAVRVVGPAGQNSQSTPSLAPVQRVRSVIVRPDGTIVTPDDATPKPEPAPPVRTASLPQTSGSAVTSAAPTPGPAASGLPSTQVVPMAPLSQSYTPQAGGASLPPLAPVKQIETAPVVQKPNPAPPVAIAPKPAAATPTPLIAAAPKPPAQQPASKPAASTLPSLVPHAPVADANAPLALGPTSGPAHLPPLAAPVKVANAQAPQAVAPGAPRVAPTDGGTGDYMVQISSQRSDAEARHALQAAEQKYAAFGAKGGDIQQADLGARGTYYRARLGAGSREQASALCAQIKSQGSDCVVTKR